jgi:hypothetical protein
MATGADVGTVRIWPMESQREPRTLQHSAQVDQAFFTADGRIVSRTRDNTLHEWIGYGLNHRIVYESGTVSKLALDSGRKQVFAGSKMDHYALITRLGIHSTDRSRNWPLRTVGLWQSRVQNLRCRILRGTQRKQTFRANRRTLRMWTSVLKATRS